MPRAKKKVVVSHDENNNLAGAWLENGKGCVTVQTANGRFVVGQYSSYSDKYQPMDLALIFENGKALLQHRVGDETYQDELPLGKVERAVIAMLKRLKKDCQQSSKQVEKDENKNEN